MQKGHIVIVDDEEIVRVTLSDDLVDAGYSVESFADPRDALKALQKNAPDLILSDIKMPGLNGIELLARIRTIRPDVPVVMMTAHGSVSTAVEAMKIGARDYIMKPFDIDEMLIIIERVLETSDVKKENRRLREQITKGKSLDDYIGGSDAASQVRKLIETAAQSDATVLIVGETGTGKELVADILHYASLRIGHPYVKVSCAVLSADVFESELFGHKKGAFTGADKDRIGRFRRADSGTIYLDDIDDIHLSMQVKLLRVLEDRSLEPVGSSTTVPVDVRVLASTKADLERLVESGDFRRDLFYRLNVFPLHLPPLRERPEDIPELVHHFVQKIAPDRAIEFPEEVMRQLGEHSWPGNVRELRNVVERILLLSSGSSIGEDSLACIPDRTALSAPETLTEGKGLDDAVAHVERHLIEQALALHGGNQKKAAEYLRVPPSTLRSKIARFS